MLRLFAYFFALGCTSFGGPVAHIGYFQKLFVEKLNWLSLPAFQQLVAISQVLPGPGSSQVGFAIGLHKFGLLGGILAFIGFTLPSFCLLYFLSIFQDVLVQWGLEGVYAGLKLFAVIVVVDAIWTMGKNFCTARDTFSICICTALLLTFINTAWITPLVICLAGLIGYVYNQTVPQLSPQNKQDGTWVIKHIRFIPLISFFILLIGLPLIHNLHPVIDVFEAFYQAGALVFGGGHVVLPLLQQSIGQSVEQDVFLTGYAAAQVIPGPMFTFATYLGAEWFNKDPFIGATVATFGVFLPGLLLMYALFNSWTALMEKPKLMHAVKYINACVVGIVVAALYNPIGVNAISSLGQLALVISGILLLKYSPLPLYVLAICSMVAGALFF